MAASFGGSTIFGRSVEVKHLPNPAEFQATAFFSIDGVYRTFGGTRGRRFVVTGVLFGTTIPDVYSARAVFETYNDGVARVLADEKGNSWSDVVFTGQVEEGRLCYGHGGWCLPYTAEFEGGV